MGVTGGYQMATPSRIENVAWFSYGASPGLAGDAVIAGHLDGPRGEPAVFWRLSELKAGDQILVTTGGREVRFQVVERAYVGVGTNPPGLYEQGGAARLTLITCAGAWDAGRQTYSQRLVVEARPA